MQFEDPSDTKGFYDPALLEMQAEESIRVRRLMEFTARMRQLRGPDEESHGVADEILIEVCKLLVMSDTEKECVAELIDAYLSLDKWSA